MAPADKTLLNQAFIFLKPHANTEKARALVAETLKEKNIKILQQGDIGAARIKAEKLVDKHYYSIASKATLTQPKDLAVDPAKFEHFFGEKWCDVLAAGKACTALEAQEKLKVDAEGLDKIWAATKAAGKIIKLGGGFYCGKISSEGQEMYTFNAFFMQTVEKYTKEGTGIHWYCVEWEPSTMAWADFRGKLLGPTDPANAPVDSLRGLIAAQWKELGLEAACNTGDNAVHASASPFEAACERLTWLGRESPFWTELKKQIPMELLHDWSKDPRVKYGPVSCPIESSIFDSVEDLDLNECGAKLLMIAGCNVQPAVKPNPIAAAPVTAPADPALVAAFATIKHAKKISIHLGPVVNLHKKTLTALIADYDKQEKGKGKGKGKGEKGDSKGKGEGKGEGKGKGKGEGKGKGKGFGKGK